MNRWNAENVQKVFQILSLNLIVGERVDTKGRKKNVKLRSSKMAENDV